MRLILAGLAMALTASSYFAKDLGDLPLNKVQVIGSHNSYKQAIDPALFKLLQQHDSSMARHIDYSHVGLSEQLTMGLQNLEIDVYADAKGGKYQHPAGLDMASGQAPYTGEHMQEPGFKVFHIQEIDFRSHCNTFRVCLQELKQWSDAHKGHYPVFITINAKDDTIKRLGFTAPEKFTAEVYDALDKELVEGLGKDKLLTPDAIRGKYKTLEEAVLKNNWPTLKQAAGKFIFILDESAPKRAAYIAGHLGLQGRMLFVNASAGTPEAGILIMNEPLKEGKAIQDMVRKGYIVRTRADADTEEARRNDRNRFEAACASGAQIITTDYYAKSKHFNSDYIISFDNGKYIRPNTVLK